MIRSHVLVCGGTGCTSSGSKAIREKLAAQKLRVKDNWQIFPVEARGLDFLGFVFRHGYVRLRKRIKRNLFRTLAHLRKVCKTTKEIRLAVASYIGWLKYTNSRNLINTLNTFSYGKVF